MVEFLRQLFTGIAEAWQRLSINARVQIALAAILTVAFLIGVVAIGSGPQYVRLYSRLDPDESNEIVVWLEDNDIPYQLRDGGASVEVPIQDVQRARIELVDLGLPTTQGVSEGFELFSDRDLMTNQWLQNVNFMRALQGTLQRQLNQFDFVRKSFVFIREAPEQLFVSEQKPSQANVILETNRQLTKREVKAVLHMVSSFGGANLNPKNITLSLSDGTLLHSPAEDEFASLASGKLEAQAELEAQREAKVRKAFQDLGVNAIIKVSVLMDWTDEERNVRQVTAGQTVSTEETSTTITSTEGPPEGAPGAVANIPEGLGAAGTAGSSEQTSVLTETIDPSESLTKTTVRPGVVQKFRVSAFIEGSYAPVLDENGDDTGQTEYQPLSDEDIDKYTQFIANAVGTGEEETEIVVFDHPFRIERMAAAQTGPVSAAAVPFVQRAWENDVVKFFMQGILMLGAFFLVRVFMRRAMVLPTVEEEEVIEIPEATKADLRRQEIAAEVERLSHEEPETVAALLRSWITED